MRKLILLSLAVVIVFVLNFGCTKKKDPAAPDAENTPADTATYIPTNQNTNTVTATSTPTSTQTVANTSTGTFTSTVTATATPTDTPTVVYTDTETPTTTFTATITETGTITVTMTSTPVPVWIDNFEDGNFYNMINEPMFNQWVALKNTDSFITSLALSASGPYAGLDNFCMGVTGTAVTEISDGAGSFYGFVGLEVPLLNGSGNGIDASSAQKLNVSFTQNSANLTIVYKVILYNGADYIEYTTSRFPDWAGYQIPWSAFELPVGAGYTKNSVLANLTKIAFTGTLNGTPQGLSAEIRIHVDKIFIN